MDAIKALNAVLVAALTSGVVFGEEARRPVPDMPLAAAQLIEDAQVRPARRAQGADAAGSPRQEAVGESAGVTDQYGAQPSMQAAYHVAVMENEHYEPDLPEPKFTLLPTSPNPVPSQMLQLVRRRKAERDKHDLARRLRLAANEEVVFYGPEQPADKEAEMIPPGLPGEKVERAPEVQPTQGQFYEGLEGQDESQGPEMPRPPYGRGGYRGPYRPEMQQTPNGADGGPRGTCGPGGCPIGSVDGGCYGPECGFGPNCGNGPGCGFEPGCGPDCGCGPGCGPGDCGPDCFGDGWCPPLGFWQHCNNMFGEALVLDTNGADVPFAIQDSGSGLIGTIGQDFEAGYRAGFTRTLSDCASIGASFAQFRSHAENRLDESSDGAADVVSLVGSSSGPADGLSSPGISASYDIDFQTIDVVISHTIAGDDRRAVNGVIGARYGTLQQEFRQHGLFGNDTEIEQGTNIDFHGVGLRTGLDVRRRVGYSPLSLYGKTFINALFGRFKSEYSEYDDFGGLGNSNSVSWEDDRTVVVLECEAGASWCEGPWRLSAGYQAACWTNVVSTPEFIQAVQTSHFGRLDDTITFHGLVARLEYRY